LTPATAREVRAPGKTMEKDKMMDKKQ